MLSIFDHAVGARAKFLLLIDGLVSLARQWGLRPEFWEAVSPRQQLDPDGVPSFYTFAPFHPQTQAVIHGLLLSVAFFCVICFGIRYSSIRILHVNIPAIQFDEPIASQVGPSTAPTTSKASAVAPASPHKAVIAIPPPVRTSDNPPIAPVGIATQNKSFGTTHSSKSQGPSRSLSPALNAALLIGVTLQDYVGTYVVQSRGRLTILVSEESRRLMMKVAGQPKLGLTAVSETKFMVAGTEDWVEFVEDKTGTDGNRIQELRLFQGGQLLIAQRKLPEK